MDLTNFLLVFLVFLKTDLLLATTSQVAPPTNVTFHCHNLQNFLKWDYGQIQPGLKFKVYIGSESGLGRCSNELWVEKPPLQADVSFLSDPDVSFYLDVRAVIGSNESNFAPPDGITFSYFHGTMANQKCYVDLPPVSVTSHPDNHVMFRFEHPWLMYHNKLSTCKKHKKKKEESLQNPPLFTYHATVAGREHTYFCEERVCEQTLFVDAAQEKPCLHISGEFLKMSVKPKQEYCAQPIKADYNHTAIYAVVGIIILMAVVGVIFMVYHIKTRSSFPLPNSIKTFATVEAQLTTSPELDNINTPDSPTPLLTSIEETGVQQDTFIHAVNGSTENDLRMRLGMSSNNTSESVNEGTANGEGSAYIQGGNLDEEEEEEPENSWSPYERRPVPVQLAPDDRTEGYRG